MTAGRRVGCKNAQENLGEPAGMKLVGTSKASSAGYRAKLPNQAGVR